MKKSEYRKVHTFLNIYRYCGSFYVFIDPLYIVIKRINYTYQKDII